MIGKHARRARNVNDFWVSYSDLMAGLLLVFILVTMIVLHRSQEAYEIQSRIYEEQSSQLKKAHDKLGAIDKDVSKILGVRKSIVARLKIKFSESGKDIHFDDATGAIRLGSNILFAEGSPKLRKTGQDALTELIPIYYDALLGDPELRRHVGQIVFEGHTNSNYKRGKNVDEGYLSNLQLSQERAYQAMSFIVKSEVGKNFKAKELLAANGYSSSRPVLKNDIEDKELSRRLEIRFRLKNEAALSKLSEIFNELGKN